MASSPKAPETPTDGSWEKTERKFSQYVFLLFGSFSALRHILYQYFHATPIYCSADTTGLVGRSLLLGFQHHLMAIGSKRRPRSYVRLLENTIHTCPNAMTCSRYFFLMLTMSSLRVQEECQRVFRSLSGVCGSES